MAERSILVVDDNEINRGILGEIFKDKYNILEAGDGVQAMKMIEENKDNLAAVLLDIIMPEMDGYEITLKVFDSPFTILILVVEGLIYPAAKSLLLGNIV